MAAIRRRLEIPQCDDDDIDDDMRKLQFRRSRRDRNVDVFEHSHSGAPRMKAAQSRKIGSRRYRLARGVTVDSGAADNVMPRRLLRGKSSAVRPSEASRAGVHYVACNNGRIPNEGEAEMEFTTQEGHDHRWTFQIAEVNKVLASVSSLVDEGHRVIFDRDPITKIDTSFIIHKQSGNSTKLRRERNVWVVDAWIEEGEPDPDTPFVRQG